MIFFIVLAKMKLKGDLDAPIPNTHSLTEMVRTASVNIPPHSGCGNTCGNRLLDKTHNSTYVMNQLLDHFYTTTKRTARQLSRFPLQQPRPHRFRAFLEAPA